MQRQGTSFELQDGYLCCSENLSIESFIFIRQAHQEVMAVAQCHITKAWHLHIKQTSSCVCAKFQLFTNAGYCHTLRQICGMTWVKLLLQHIGELRLPRDRQCGWWTLACNSIQICNAASSTTNRNSDTMRIDKYSHRKPNCPSLSRAQHEGRPDHPHLAPSLQARPQQSECHQQTCQ